MTGYQPGRRRGGSERPGRYRSGPDGPLSRGAPGNGAPGSPRDGRSQAGDQDRNHAERYLEGRARSRNALPPDSRGDLGGWERGDARSHGDPGGWGRGDARSHGDPGGWRRGHARRRDTTGGADGNERLTALTGALLLGLLAAEGITILAIHRLLTLHFFIGMLLAGPVLLKAGSTGYRFARYYAGAPDYRRKGPPAPLLRLLGPFVLGLSLAVVGSGIMLAVTGPSGQLWIFLHKASFVLWFGAMSIHVLAYVWRLPRLVTSDLATGAGARARDVLAGRRVRWLLLAASILLGLLLALLTYRQAGAWAGFGGG